MPELIQDALAEAAAERPHGPALRYRGTEWSWQRLSEEASAVAASLVSLEVRPGDRVGLLLPKRPEAVAGFYGILMAGGVYVPLDPLAPAAYAAAVASDCGIGVVIATPSRVAELADALPPGTLRAALLVADGSTGTAEGVVTLPYPGAGEQLVASPARSPGDLALIAYTSGSSGQPKGVMISHRGLLLHGEWQRNHYGIVAEDRLAAFPPMHFKMAMYAFVTAALARAAAVLIALETGFRGQDLARIIQSEGITHWLSVTSPLREIAEAGAARGSLPSLRTIQAGGGAWRPQDLRAIRFLAPQVELWHSYGSAETSTTFVHRIDEIPDDSVRIPVGQPLPDVRVALIDDDGSRAGPGGQGELFVTGPRVMLGYWNDPDRTARVLVPDPTGAGDHERWCRTGDVLRLDQDSEYVFVGRRDDMIKSRGYRVELGTVEVALATHPLVSDAAVIGVPHERWGMAIVAFIELRSGSDGDVPTEATLRGHVASLLPTYMVPWRVQVLPDMPRTSTGKPDRVKLTALAVAAAEGNART